MTTRSPAALALERGSPAMRALVELVQTAYGDRTLGDTAIVAALELRGGDGLPETPVEVMRFLRSHLLGILTEEIGPRLTMAVVDDLLEQFTLAGATTATLPPVSAPRPVRVGRVSARLRRPSVEVPEVEGEEDGSRPSSLPPPRAGLPPRVALVDSDRIGRTALARALVRAGCEVILIDSVADLEAAFDAGDLLPAALVDTRHGCATEILRALVLRRPDAMVVARGPDLTRARALAEGCGIADVRVRSHDTAASDLIEALRRRNE